MDKHIQAGRIDSHLVKASFSSVDFEPVTLALAKQIRELEPIPAEMGVSKTRLAFLEKSIKASGPTVFTWADCFCCADGKTYRINGKHSTELIVTGRIPAEGYAVIQHFICNDTNEVVRLWRGCNCFQQVHFKSEVLKSMMDLKKKEEVTP